MSAGRIEVAAVGQYPSKRIARQALDTDLPYRGVWVHPQEPHPLVHVFAAASRQAIETMGWAKP